MPQVCLQDYIEAAHHGAVIALPTDSVWGLAVNPDHSSSLYTLKQRPLEKSLILLGATAADLWPYVTLDPTPWHTITSTHWPGQLTLVVPASADVPPEMHPHTPNTIGVRVPDHPIARQVLAHTGPLATTSANLSGQPALTTLDQVLAQFPQVYGLDLSTLPLPDTELPVLSGLPSTVACWQSNGWKILRQGTVYL